IWFEVLYETPYPGEPGSNRFKPIGTGDNFFEIGGHSLKAVNMVSKIHKVFHTKVPLAEVFISPTIRGLAEYIKRASEDVYTSIEPVEKKEYYVLSAAQKRLYFIQQLDLESTTYNHPVLKVLTGPINRNRLEQVFRRLINRQESLRTSFRMMGDEVVQEIHHKVSFEIE
ncbi:MAG: hypothetical protein GY940_10210, partial [bacterium]|nr:hypothetical protein [bacterium]